jgi:PadR family transcriptional regulator, regulatory protein AphA
MSLRYALLAALHEAPATGYELTQRFRRRLAHVWSASHQQVYRELGKLHEEGKLAMTEVPQLDKPDRKLYQITGSGQDDLRQWLATPQPGPVTRDPLLVKLFAGDLLDPSAMEAEVRERRAETQRQLETFKAIEREYFTEPAALPMHYHMQYLALRRGITAMQATLKWLDELAAALGREAQPSRRGVGGISEQGMNPRKSRVRT